MATAPAIDREQFVFDEASHTYSVNGLVIPSVTQILSDMGYSNIEAAERFNPEALERKRQLGKLVHQACHYHDENDLDTHDAQGHLLIPEVVFNRLEAYRKFRADTGYKPIVNEGRGVGELYGMKYGMQFDSIGQCHGKLPWWIVDIKNASGSPQRAWAIQTGAYAMGQKALPKVSYSAFVRVIVQLFDDRSYKLFTSQDRGSRIFKPEDFQVWQACLAVSIDKRNHAIERR
jgi:hypothetical protein